MAHAHTKKDKYDPKALKLLKEIPGISSERDLKHWLYKAAVLPYQNETRATIRSYIKNSQEHGFKIKVLDVIRIVRNGSIDFKHDEKKSKRFRMMLWHGTKENRVANILHNGFRKPPVSGQMFGAGIYFADRASKSARYCPTNQSPGKPENGSIGYLFLCDVLLGEMFHSKTARNAATAPPSYTDAAGKEKHCDSVRCTGEWVPDRKSQKRYGHCIWPMGETVKNKKFDSYTLQYNEYIVYNPDNIRIKYLVKVRFQDD